MMVIMVGLMNELKKGDGGTFMLASGRGRSSREVLCGFKEEE